MGANQAARALEALGDPTRRTVFELVARRPMAVGEIAAELPVSRPAVSQHLRVLREAQLVESREQGTRRIYAVRGEGLAELRSFFERFWQGALAEFASAAAGPGSTADDNSRRTAGEGKP